MSVLECCTQDSLCTDIFPVSSLLLPPPSPPSPPSPSLPCPYLQQGRAVTMQGRTPHIEGENEQTELKPRPFAC
eukprot:1610506-Rhodomonas_salina.1